MNLFRKFRALFGREKLDAEMSDEMRAHLELQTAENIRRGMSADDARYSAQREFGGVEQLKERARDQRGWVWLEQLRQDGWHAGRGLLRNPMFVFVAVTSLAIGLGANIAMFGWFETMAWRPLPVKKPNELVLLGWHRTAKEGAPRSDAGGEIDFDTASGDQVRRVFSWSAFERLRSAAAPMAEVFGVARREQPNLTIDGQPERVDVGDFVSGNYFEALGVKAALGRTLRAEDDQLGATPVIVISHRYWERRFGRDPAIVGQSLLLNRTPVVIVGVTAPGFGGTIAGQPAPVTGPLALAENVFPDAAEMPLRDARHWWVRVMARVKPGVSPEQLRASAEGAFREAAAPGWTKPEALPRLLASPGGYGRSERTRQQQAANLAPIALLAWLLLAVACANLANLILARGLARRREFAVRLALGAGRFRLVRQLLAENILLALLGAVAGVGVAFWGGQLLFTGIFAPSQDIDEMALHLDWRVAGFGFALAVCTGIAFGLVPAWRATRLDLTAEFQGGTRTLGGRGSRLGRGLMIAQVGLSVVLLVVAGVLERSVRNLRAVDIGFERERLLLFSINGASAGYAEGSRLEALYRQVAERIATLGGVTGVTYSQAAVLSSDSGRMVQFQRTSDTSPSPEVTDTRMNQVDASFFEIYGVPLVAGRGFTSLDRAGGAPVIVVNQAFATKYFPGASALGERLTFGRGRNRRHAEIVGVVRDFRQKTLRVEVQPMIFAPVAQQPVREANFAVRTVAAPEALTAAIRRLGAEIDPALPLANVRTQAQQIEWTTGEARLLSRLALSLGGAALALASIGLYGLMAYGVSRRTSEIGLRIALGALPAQVRWSILRESLGLAFIGVAFGLAGAAAATRLVASELYGVSPTDPLTLAGVAVLLVATAALASWLPARRAAKVDPMVALRAE